MDVTKESGELRSGQSKTTWKIGNRAVIVGLKQKITEPTVAVNRNFSLHFENNDAGTDLKRNCFALSGEEDDKPS